MCTTYRLHALDDPSKFVIVSKEEVCVSLMLKDMVEMDEEEGNVIDIPIAGVDQFTLDRLRDWMVHYKGTPPGTALHRPIPNPIPLNMNLQGFFGPYDWHAIFLQTVCHHLPELKACERLLITANYLDMPVLTELLFTSIVLYCSTLLKDDAAMPEWNVHSKLLDDNPWIFDIPDRR